MNRMPALPPPPSRRRFIGITAAAAGLALLPLGAGAATAPLRVWRGVALGADAMLQIQHPDVTEADRLIGLCLAEVSRLEAIFSLYRPDSAILRLNRTGWLAEPPPDLLRILGEAAAFGRLTGGAFDITVQPLWRLYAAHFSRADADPAGPAAAAIAAVLPLVGQAAIEFDPAAVRLPRPGMAITLNGIAQGYVTDRVAELLLASGIERALVDMGETRALGDRPGGGPWRIGLEDPAHPGEVAETVALRSRAIATSGGYGTPFDAHGRFNHIFDPATGGTSRRYRAISVLAASATAADALSTAFCVMPLAAIAPVVERLGLALHVVLADGTRQVLGA